MSAKRKAKGTMENTAPSNKKCKTIHTNSTMFVKKAIVSVPPKGKGGVHKPSQDKHRHAKQTMATLFSKTKKTIVEEEGKEASSTHQMEMDLLFAGLKAKKKEKEAQQSADRERREKEIEDARVYRKELEKLEKEHQRKNNDTSSTQAVPGKIVLD
jgi:hypothetical protein